MTTPQPVPPAPGQPTSPPPQPPQALAVPTVRVNLLPDSVLARESAARARVIAGGCAVAAVLVVGGLYLMAVNEANQAQEELDSAQAVQSQLQVEALKYAAVPEAYDTVASAQAALAQAMATDVRWSFILNDLSLTIPDGVGLLTMDAGLTAGAAPTTPPVEGSPTVIGTLSYTGQARSYDGVAAWLDSQSQQEIYTDAYFTTAAKEPDSSSGQTVVTFSSTVSVTDAAYSGRFGPPPTTPVTPPSDQSATPSGASATPRPTGGSASGVAQ